MRYVLLIAAGMLVFSTAAQAKQPATKQVKRQGWTQFKRTVRRAVTSLKYLPRRIHNRRHPSSLHVGFAAGADALQAAPLLRRLARRESSSTVNVTWGGKRYQIHNGDSVGTIVQRLTGSKAPRFSGLRSIFMPSNKWQIRRMKISVGAGDHLNAAARVMTRTANREGIRVEGSFSQKTLVAGPGTSRRSILRQYGSGL